MDGKYSTDIKNQDKLMKTEDHKSESSGKVSSEWNLPPNWRKKDKVQVLDKYQSPPLENKQNSIKNKVDYWITKWEVNMWLRVFYRKDSNDTTDSIQFFPYVT